MTFEQFISELRDLAATSGIVADERYWLSANWLANFSDGLTPADALAELLHPALRAL